MQSCRPIPRLAPVTSATFGISEPPSVTREALHMQPRSSGWQSEG
jgi:hypothetical protein